MAVDKIKARNLQAVTVAALIILLAVAALIIGLTDETWYTALYVVLLGFGLILVLRSAAMPSARDYAGPSAQDMSLVAGMLVAAIGAIGLVSVFTDVGIWVLVAIFLIVVALIIMIQVLRSRR